MASRREYESQIALQVELQTELFWFHACMDKGTSRSNGGDIVFMPSTWEAPSIFVKTVRYVMLLHAPTNNAPMSQPSPNKEHKPVSTMKGKAHINFLPGRSDG